MFKDKYGKSLSWEEAKPKIMRRLNHYFLDCELLLLTWVGLIPFHSVRLFCYKLAGITIGRDSRIHIGCRFYFPSGITIGKGTIIGDNVFLDGRAPLHIGSHVAISSYVLIYNSEHDIDSDDFRVKEEPVVIEDYVYIGPRAIILPGVKIGYGAVVAAGAVVTKDVPSSTLVGGIPAKEIRTRRQQKLTYRLGRARLFQ